MEAAGVEEARPRSLGVSSEHGTNGASRTRTKALIDVHFEEPLVARASFVFGNCHIFDCELTDPSNIPTSLPAKKYMEEALVGLRDAPHRKEASSPSRVSKRVRAQRYKRLETAITSEAAARQACEALFWLSLGIIFDMASEQTFAELRRRFGHAWYLLQLHCQKLTAHDPDARELDRLLSSLPLVMVQACYRLLVDAFGKDERTAFVADAHCLLDKLTCVANFEVNGFQPSRRTNNEARQRLFTDHVIAHPFVDQQENARIEERRERIESSMAAAGSKALRFGEKNSLPIDEIQMEHILMGREEELAKFFAKAYAPKEKKEDVNKTIVPDLAALCDGAATLAIQTSVPDGVLRRRALSADVLDELSVDRYDGLEELGKALLEMHLRENDPDDYMPQTDSMDLTEEDAAPPEAPEQGTPPEESSHGQRPLSQGRRLSGPTDKHRTHTKASASHSHNETALLRLMEKKNAEKTEKRRREELLKKHLFQPLPAYLMANEVETDWVSPVTDRVAPADKPRKYLRKGFSESRKVRMTRSTPTLVVPTQGAFAADFTPAKDEMSTISRAPSQLDDGTGTHRHRAHTEEASQLSFLQEKPALPSNDPGRLQERKQQMLHLNLDVTKRMNHEVVLGRLQTQLKCFHERSFKAYARNHDMFTGVKKTKMDPQKLRAQERSFVSDLQGLVGGPGEMALRLPRGIERNPRFTTHLPPLNDARPPPA
eukprot:TRINITY_DN8996_c0_g1_i1.p1 TRINITY_DN8996_c0_g1~~TRINITY_DN8996_c0_g1_i1.p1  ORF type:complete len:716 (-),score=190.90 TRINITY_DN8996_c0_g1_i1:191-2338(-)